MSNEPPPISGDLALMLLVLGLVIAFVILLR